MDSAVHNAKMTGRWWSELEFTVPEAHSKRVRGDLVELMIE